MAAVTARSAQRYAFEAGEFGQPVALSEVDRRRFNPLPASSPSISTSFIATTTPTRRSQPRLIAERPAMGADGLVQAAELLAAR